MANLNKTDKSFKILINKRFTSDADRNQGRAFFQENGADTINVHSREVWTNPVPSDPNDALTNGIAKYHDKFILTPDPVVGSSNTTQQAWFFQSGSGFTPGIDTGEGGTGEYNDSFTQTDFIGDKYGLDYTVQLFTNDDQQIFPTNPINWIFDYKVGVLHIANPNASHSKPYKVSVYQYIGNTLSSSVNDEGLIEAVGFPYSGSDFVGKENTPNQAIITGSLLVSGSGHITASGNISASGFVGPLTGDATGLSGQPNIIVGTISSSNITASGHISASGNITASVLYLSGDADIDGNLDVAGIIINEGFNFVEDNITILTGSNSFGATASFNNHTFTGSIIISSSQASAFTVLNDTTTTVTISPAGKITALEANITNITASNITASGDIKANRILLPTSSIDTPPVYTFDGDEDTGMYHEEQNGIGFKGAGSDMLTLQPSKGAEFKINITSSGDISSSGLLFTSASTPTSHVDSIVAVVYDTASGRFYYTGSYGSGGGGVGKGFPYSGSDFVGEENTPNQAIITGSLLVLGGNSFTSASGHITASGNISASRFRGIFDGALSSSNQIASDISGSWQGYISGSGIISSSTQLSGDFLTQSPFTHGGISGSWQGYISGSGIISSSEQLTGNFLASSPFTEAGISGSFLGYLSGSGIVSNSLQFTSQSDVEFRNITASIISASGIISASEFVGGNITASKLLLREDAVISGNLDLGGTFTHEGFNFVEDNTVSITGNNSFGSIADTNIHTFTGSIIISSSQTNAFTIVSGSTPVDVFVINQEGVIVGNNIISSSNQIASDISGSWKGFISGSGIISSSTQLSSDFLAGSPFTAVGISGSWQGFISGSGIVSNSAQLSDAFLAGSPFTHGGISGSWQGFISGSGIVSSSLQIANDISGSLGANATFIRTLTEAGISGSWNGFISGSGIISSSTQLTNDFLSTANVSADSISGSWQGYISGSGIISSSIQIEQFGNFVKTNGTASLTSITASGDISSSGKLFFSSSLSNDSNFRVVVVDTNTGQLFRTGAYAAGGGGSPINLGSLETSIIPLTSDADLSIGSQTNKFKEIFAVDTFFGGIHEINLETEGLDEMQEGTVLSLQNGILGPCNKEADPLVMGVVSKGENYPIVLGAEPVLITGKIEEGDYIITSDIKGHGKGVNPCNIYDQQLFGKIIAQAIEKGEGESYTIKAMIRKM